MKRTTNITLCLWAIAGLAWIAYAVRGGARIDENGVLQEPFHLVLIFWLCALSGALLLIVVGLRRLFGRKQ